MTDNNTAVINEFMKITGSSKKEAESFLKSCGFSLTRGLNAYFSVAPGVRSTTSKSRNVPHISDKDTAAFFTSFADSVTGRIEAEGVERIGNNLEIGNLDVAWLVIACRCRAEHMGSFSKEEWQRGMKALGCANIDSLKAALPTIHGCLANSTDDFKEVYLYAFIFSLEPGTRNISLEMATALWEILLPNAEWKLASNWLYFIKSDAVVSKGRAVTRDLWNLLLTLAKELPDTESLGAFDRDGGAWPLIVDDFFDHLTANTQK